VSRGVSCAGCSRGRVRARVSDLLSGFFFFNYDCECEC
jgi:hypothetical protein